MTDRCDPCAIRMSSSHHERGRPVSKHNCAQRLRYEKSLERLVDEAHRLGFHVSALRAAERLHQMRREYPTR